MRSFKYLKKMYRYEKAKGFIFSLVIVGLAFVGMMFLKSEHKIVYRTTDRPNFTQGRILGTPRDSYLKSKELQLEKTAKSIALENKALEARIKALENRPLPKK